jgi:hypothetical protein
MGLYPFFTVPVYLIPIVSYSLLILKEKKLLLFAEQLQNFSRQGFGTGMEDGGGGGV